MLTDLQRYPRSRMTSRISVSAAVTASAGVSTNRSWTAVQSPRSLACCSGEGS